MYLKSSLTEAAHSVGDFKNYLVHDLGVQQ